ncbi:MAG TPA: DUF192 domain-containing protein [Acidimicrobiales bacterium]
MRKLIRLLVVVGVLAALSGCNDDDDAASTGDVEPSRALTTAGDAGAAAGSQLEETPGPADRTRLGDFGEVAIAITDADGQVIGWCVLLADTSDLRQRGLMEVEDLGGYAGMLFVWDSDSTSSFYMRNTPTPLSIAWFDADGALVTETDMEPCGDLPDCPLYPADGPYRFALEVPKGELRTLGVGPGSTMRVGGDCVPADRPT